MQKKFKNSLLILSLIALIVSTWSFTWNNPRIKGKIVLKEMPEKVYLLRYDFNKSKFIEEETVLLSKNGDFKYDLPNKLPQLYQLKVNNQNIEFPVDDAAEISIRIDSAKVIITGSAHVSAIVDFKNLITDANKRHFGDLIKSGADQKKMQDKEYTKKMMKTYKYERLTAFDFWAGWCKPCLIEFSFYAELYQKYNQKGLVIIGVNKDFEEGKCRNWQKKFNLPWYTVYYGDNKISDLYMVKQLPQNIVIDKVGKIIAKNLLVWEIEGLLKEKLED